MPLDDGQPQPLENSGEWIEHRQYRAAAARAWTGSKKIGVKKMPNISTTCTMYLTSRKNRLAQLRKSDTPVVKRTSSARSSGTHTKLARGARRGTAG